MGFEELFLSEDPLYQGQILMIVYTVVVAGLIGIVLVISNRKLAIMTDPILNKSVNILGVRMYQVIRLQMLFMILINSLNIIELVQANIWKCETVFSDILSYSMTGLI